MKKLNTFHLGPLCLIKIIVEVLNTTLATGFALKGSESELSTATLTEV